MNEDRFEEFLQDAGRDYHAPPPVPREEMWARIEEARRFQRRAQPRHRSRWLHWAVGVAAVLAVGITIGRVSLDAPRQIAETRAAGTDSAASLPYRLAAIQHLTQAEALLTSFRASEGTDEDVARWAADLLTTTRLMLDSPASQDPRISQLLRDLELVLAQIAQLPEARDAEEKQYIDDAIEQKNVLPRLRANVPAGPLRAST